MNNLTDDRHIRTVTHKYTCTLQFCKIDYQNNVTLKNILIFFLHWQQEQLSMYMYIQTFIVLQKEMKYIYGKKHAPKSYNATIFQHKML